MLKLLQLRLNGLKNKMNKNKTISKPFLSWLPYLVFFAFSLAYFGFFGNYLFFYQEKSSLFIFSSEFLYENLHQPGGLLIWLGKLLSTFFYYPLAGAFIVTSVLTLILISISKILYLQAGKNSTVIPLIFGAVLFYLQTDYRFLLFNNLGLFLQLAFFYLTIRWLRFLRGWITVLITPFWYFAMGGFSWIFVLLLTLYFAFYKVKHGWIKIVVLWLLSLLFIYISKEFLFFQTEKTLMIFPFTEINTGSQQVLFLTIAGILSLLPLASRINIRLPSWINVSEAAGSFTITTLMVLFLFGIGLQRFDKKVEQYFHVEKLFYQNKYNELISFNTANPSTNSLTIFLNNIALCENGKLDDLLFHFPQSQDGKTLFLKWEMSGEILRRGGYFYYTTGMINEAHRWAFENMVMRGLTPEGLKMLIKTELINRNYEVASKYITILKHTIFYRKEANAFEKLLFNDDAVNTDSELGPKKQNKLNTDFFSITDDPYINIERVLANDSLNKKAFEYKVAFLLLRKDYQGIAKILPKFENLGFTKFPVHVEEAAMILSLFTNGKLPYLGNLVINRNTELRWNQYLSVFQQYKTDLKAAEPALKRQFGNTFWYWSFYK